MNSFIAELRRRNVFKVTAGYAVIAWLLMQLAVVLESALHLPVWFDTITTVLVLIGFPIAVLLAWIFQFSPRGMTRTLKNPEMSDALNSKHTVVIFSLTGLIAVGLVTLMWFHLGESDFIERNVLTSEESASEQSDINQDAKQGSLLSLSAATQSIAVLPFDDFSASNDQSYFGRGISEELLNVLSRIKGLRVVSRTSSFAFMGKSATVNDIAKALNVAHILEGSVRKSGDTIRITAQLINAQTDEHVWSETYDRPLSAQNLFAVQDEIASAIVGTLKGKLTVVPLEASDKTLSLEAYELYLQARENQKLRTPESLALAVEGFTKVIDLDPNFAQPYSGLAETYLLMEAYAGLDKAESQEKAAPLVARALELAPNSAEVLSAAAYLASDRNTADSIIEAEQYALQAIASNENYANAYFLLGGIMWEQGRLKEAIENYKQARTLDPLSAVVLSNLARIYLYVGDQKSAQLIGEDLIRLHPSMPFGYIVSADIANKQGDYANAHRILQDAYSINQENIQIKKNLRAIYNLVALYDYPLEYYNTPTTQVWYAIYTNNLAIVANELPRVKEITDIGWFMYYLRDYAKTQQIVNAYIDAYQLLDRAIADSGSADFIIAYAQTQKALGESNDVAMNLLNDYFTPVNSSSLTQIREIEQRVLYCALAGNYEQSYEWIDRMISLGYVMVFIDPIFDDIRQSSEFLTRQENMQKLRNTYQQEIQSQLASPKPNWFIPAAIQAMTQ